MHVGLSSERAVRSAFDELTALAAGHGGIDRAEGEGVVIQPMIAGGVETMIGVTDDPLFGPLVASASAASTSKCSVTSDSGWRR